MTHVGVTERKLRADLRSARLHFLAADRELADTLESHSWELTRPARRFAHRFPRAGRWALRALRPLTWLLAGELRARLRVRLGGPSGDRSASRDLPRATLDPALLPPPVPAPSGQTILIIDDSVPQPDRSAGGRTTHDFITTLLMAGWGVAFAPYDGRDGGEYTTALAALGVPVIDGQVRGGIAAWLALHGPALDQVMLMRPEPADAMLPVVLRTTDARLSYYGHDLHFARLRLRAALESNIELAEIADRQLAVERRIWRAVDVVLYPSADEAAMVRELVPGVDACAVPMLGFDSFPPMRSPPAGASLLFVGNFNHAPNVDAILWFTSAVFPQVRAARPDARLVIAGSGPNPTVLALAGGGVEVTGYLTDETLQRCYEAARVVVVPLRFGAGVKGKVVEALRNGVPVVTTSVGAEGMPGLADIVPVHDAPAAMAAAILRLLDDDAAWAEQAGAQIAYARAHFSRDTLRGALLGALGQTARSGLEAQAPSCGNPNEKGPPCLG